MASSQDQKIGRIGILPWLMKVATYLTIVLMSTSAERYLTEYGSSSAKELVFPIAAVVIFAVGLYTGDKSGRIAGVFFAAMVCLWAVGVKTALLWILKQDPGQLMQSTPMLVGVLIMVARYCPRSDSWLREKGWQGNLLVLSKLNRHFVI